MKLPAFFGLAGVRGTVFGLEFPFIPEFAPSPRAHCRARPDAVALSNTV